MHRALVFLFSTLLFAYPLSAQRNAIPLVDQPLIPVSVAWRGRLHAYCEWHRVRIGRSGALEWECPRYYFHKFHNIDCGHLSV